MEVYRAVLRFDPCLRELLPTRLRAQEAIPVEFKGNPAAKHLIEALGVPHTEVGELRVNGELRGLAAHLGADDDVEIFSPQDGAGEYSRPGEPRFVADLHLGRLAAHLRMLGFDTLYQNNYEDPELAQIAETEGRVLLTRDRRLLMRREVAYGCCLRSLEPHEQIEEVVRRYGLAGIARPFRRCLRCNQLLRPASKAEVFDRLEPLTQLYFEEFALCPGCNQVYWKGSHYEHMLTLIQELR